MTVAYFSDNACIHLSPPHNTHRCWRARPDGNARRPSRFRLGMSRSDLSMYVRMCMCLCCVLVYACACASMHLLFLLFPPR